MESKRRCNRTANFLLAFLVLILVTIYAPPSGALVSVGDDLAKVLVSLGKVLTKGYTLTAKQAATVKRIANNVDEFYPQLRSLPKNQRMDILLRAAEENGLVSAASKLQFHRGLMSGKYDELELVRVIRNREVLNGMKAARMPLNSSQYAGKIYPAEKLKEISPELARKYPNGVKFTDDGYPDFSPYATKTVKPGKLTGNNEVDKKLANDAAGYQRTPEGHVWHHHQDCEKMLLVPLDLHLAVKHSGGAEKLRGGGTRCPF